jgi:hypothetical protein
VIDNNNNAYYVVVTLGGVNPGDSTIQLGSVRVGYVLQVSPAPATARFNDVPTSHPFFQFIEALGVVGTLSGVVLIGLPAKTTTALAMSRPLVTATISNGSQKAVIGTITGVTVIDIPSGSSVEASPTPPVLNILPGP